MNDLITFIIDNLFSIYKSKNKSNIGLVEEF